MAPPKAWYWDYVITIDNVQMCKACLLERYTRLVLNLRIRQRDDEVIAEVTQEDFDNAAAMPPNDERVKDAVQAVKNDASCRVTRNPSEWSERHTKNKHKIESKPNETPTTNAEYKRWSAPDIGLFAKFARVLARALPPVGGRVQLTMHDVKKRAPQDPEQANETLLYTYARNRLPFRLIEDPGEAAAWAALGATITTRQTLASQLTDFAAKLKREFFAGVKQELVAAHTSNPNALTWALADVCFDSGSRFAERYFAIVVHLRKRPAVVYELLPDSALGDEEAFRNGDLQRQPRRATVENLLPHMKRVFRELEQYNVHVASATSDNALNMIGLSLKCGRLDIRCACHGLQLLAKVLDEGSIIPAAVAAAKDFREENKAVPAMQSVATLRDQHWSRARSTQTQPFASQP